MSRQDGASVAFLYPMTIKEVLNYGVVSNLPMFSIKDAQDPNNNSDAVAVNADPGSARFSDMFLGDDALNKDSVDLSKVQMFYFTIILVFGYAVALGGVFLYKSDLQFPAIADGFLALLGISHAGYLSYKAVPRNPG